MEGGAESIWCGGDLSWPVQAGDLTTAISLEVPSPARSLCAVVNLKNSESTVPLNTSRSFLTSPDIRSKNNHLPQVTSSNSYCPLDDTNFTPKRFFKAVWIHQHPATVCGRFQKYIYFEFLAHTTDSHKCWSSIQIHHPTSKALW